MSSCVFRCSCKAELTVEAPADDVLKVYEVWALGHSHRSHDDGTKVLEALRAKELLENGMTLRETAIELRYNHPQSIKYLITRYSK